MVISRIGGVQVSTGIHRSPTGSHEGEEVQTMHKKRAPSFAPLATVPESNVLVGLDLAGLDLEGERK